MVQLRPAGSVCRQTQPASHTARPHPHATRSFKFKMNGIAYPAKFSSRDAVKFTEQAPWGLAVSAEPPSNGEMLLKFEVKHTGIGIPAEKPDRTLKPLPRATDGGATLRWDRTGADHFVAPGFFDGWQHPGQQRSRSRKLRSVHSRFKVPAAPRASVASRITAGSNISSYDMPTCRGDPARGHGPPSKPRGCSSGEARRHIGREEGANANGDSNRDSIRVE